MSETIQPPVINFEPGIHPLTEADQNAAFEQVKKGDLASAWNGAVGERISEYAPSVVATDSMIPIWPNSEGKVVPALADKTYLWLLLPGTPRELNGTDEIKVIVGDNTFYNSEPDQVEFTFLAYSSVFLAAAIGSQGDLSCMTPGSIGEITTT